jgi:hypothetical protein
MAYIEILRYQAVETIMKCTDETLLDLVSKLLIIENKEVIA